jgi:hypothetical protein
MVGKLQMLRTAGGSSARQQAVIRHSVGGVAASAVRMVAIVLAVAAMGGTPEWLVPAAGTAAEVVAGGAVAGSAGDA